MMIIGVWGFFVLFFVVVFCVVGNFWGVVRVWVFFDVFWERESE